MRPTPSPRPHLRARPRDRRFEEAKLFFDAHAERGKAVRIAGAGADDDFTRRCRQERSLHDILDLIRRKYRDHDRVAVARYVGERSGAPSDLQKPLVSRRVHVGNR
jgi:hypothetical protein